MTTTYANGRRMFDADSHLMETVNWLSSYARPEQAGLIGPLATEAGGARVLETIAAAEARHADPVVRELGVSGRTVRPVP